MPTPEAIRHRRRVAAWITFVAVVNLIALYRIQQSVGDIRRLGDRLDQNCRDRAIARQWVRDVEFADPDTSAENVLRIATEFQDIPCPQP